MGIKIGDRVKGFNDTELPNESCNEEFCLTFGKIGIVTEIDNRHSRISIEFKVNNRTAIWDYDLNHPKIKRYTTLKSKLK